MGVQAYGDIGDKADAELGGVEDRAVAFDDACAFHVLHAAQAGRGRQADAFGQFLVGDAGVALQFRQNAQVVTVEFAHQSVLGCNYCGGLSIQG